MSLMARTKAETLAFLSERLQTGYILPFFWFSRRQWQQDQKEVLRALFAHDWSHQALVVRSSAHDEDGQRGSQAGHYRSVLNVVGETALIAAIEQVAESLEGDPEADQILIQPLLEDVVLSGVAFSCDPSTGAPWLVFNYQDQSSDTTAVTAGQTNQLKTWYYYLHANPCAPDPRLQGLVALVYEVQTLLEYPALDLEVACCHNGQWVLFQARPLLAVKPWCEVEQHHRWMTQLAHFLEPMESKHPFLFGHRTIYGVMPDWNPAEMIGIRPRPLARTLYQELITDSIWAYQRNNYGYRNLRSFPLMLNLGGCPYIDVRVSFNSFIPATLPADLAEKLVDYYLQRLIDMPAYHDKVEFEIIFSCYTLDLPERLAILYDWGFQAEEVELLAQHLRDLTHRILHRETGLWKKDIAKLDILSQRRTELLHSELGPRERIYWLLEDCKRYGTLPFAGLARAGFIAVQMLDSLVRTGILSVEERACFLRNLNTISQQMQHDYSRLSRSEFLAIYGHLRPGTYDILSPRYDQALDHYFAASRSPDNPPSFRLSLEQFKQIEEALQTHSLALSVLELFDFIKAAIEGREFAKFLFTRHLSDLLEEIATLAAGWGWNREDCSFLDIQVLCRALHSSRDLKEVMETSIAQGRQEYALTQTLVLPPLITRPEQIWQFYLEPGTPNYITQGRVQGPVRFCEAPPESLKGAILLIPSADPGYDWIFNHGIAGLITLYGGVNSHMAIRAGEMGIPAVIGAGEVLYQQWQKAQLLEIDAATRQVRILA